MWLTHFPLLSFEDRCREAQLLYSAHLDQLAPPPAVLPATPARSVVLSGHLHLRATTTAANVLQLAFAALVEAPYEVAVVELDTGAGVGFVPVRVSRATRCRAPSRCSTRPKVAGNSIPARVRWSRHE